MKIVLSISGGGIRGLIPALVLEEIEKRCGRRISDCCDLIAGNSTGGLIACLLTVPDGKGRPKFSAQEIVEMYKQFGKEVFKRSFVRKILTISGLVWNKYSCKPLEKLLKTYFRNTKLHEVTTEILLPAYQITGVPYPNFFKSVYAKSPQTEAENPYLWECARSTSAASSYFAPYQYNEERTYIDGGLFANNPAMCAYAESKNQWGEPEPVLLISIGTGEDLIGYPYEAIKNWGMVQWAVPYFEQTSISADATVDYMLRTFSGSFLNDKYYRLQAELDEDSLKMDDASDRNMERLTLSARRLIEKNSRALDEICDIIKKHKSMK